MFTIADAEKQYPNIPNTTLVNLYNYVTTGCPGGGFLTAVLSGDLFEAVNCADDKNQAALVNLVKLIYNDVPLCATGSLEKVQTWINNGGMTQWDKKAA